MGALLPMGASLCAADIVWVVFCWECMCFATDGVTNGATNGATNGRIATRCYNGCVFYQWARRYAPRILCRLFFVGNVCVLQPMGLPMGLPMGASLRAATMGAFSTTNGRVAMRRGYCVGCFLLGMYVFCNQWGYQWARCYQWARRYALRILCRLFFVGNVHDLVVCGA